MSINKVFKALADSTRREISMIDRSQKSRSRRKAREVVS